MLTCRLLATLLARARPHSPTHTPHPPPIPLELREKFAKALGLLKVYQGKIHALEAEVVRGSEIEEQAMRLEQTKSERSVTLEAKAAAQAARARSLEEEVQRLNRVCSELRQKQVGLQRVEQRASAAAASREQQLDSIEQREAAHRRLEELHRAHSAKKKAKSAARSAHAAAALRASASGTAPLPQPPALMRLNALAEPSARRRRTPERALRPSPARMTRKTRTPSRTPPTRTRTPPRNQTKTPPRSASRRTPPRSETPRRAVASALGALQQGQHLRQHQRQHDGASSAFSPRSMFSMESRSYDASLLDLVDLVDEVVERERSVLGSPSDAASTRSGGGGGGGVNGRGWGGQNARDDALAPASAARTLTPDSVPRSISSFYAPPRDGVPEQSLTLWNDSSGDEYRDDDDDDAYGNDDDRDDDDDSQDELETHGRGKGSFSPWRPAGVKRR